MANTASAPVAPINTPLFVRKRRFEYPIKFKVSKPAPMRVHQDLSVPRNLVSALDHGQVKVIEPGAERPRRVPCGEAGRKADAGNRHVRFDEW
ncbi:hypothetical protein [Bradyrhizobium sp. JYMT SZCCT0180]|uniref:hypothetical protein n=1 Tax=Bradyrhizobium sp. JYMT SZCCT0180 TaxID=2807666 RepID=UPI001BAB866A|nr:hypothetical protein [Bradyrhizobium sp. JYMT SZCCT0180]MBR1213955.1 hypothetical protein [Bradyrhizobium sp. JYMT SZCCT0180]